MKKLIKTIEGSECEIYSIKNHQRLFIGKATPTIEIYQNATEVNTIGNKSSQYKTYEISVIICSNPEIDSKITTEFLSSLSCFDMKMFLKRKDGVFVPFELAQITDFDIEAYDKWIFSINDYDITKQLMSW